MRCLALSFACVLCWAGCSESEKPAPPLQVEIKQNQIHLDTLSFQKADASFVKALIMVRRARKTGEESAILRLAISDQIFWYQVADVANAASLAGYRSLAIVTPKPPAQAKAVSMLLVRLATEDEAEVKTLRLPRIVPWTVAASKVKKAIGMGKALRFAHEQSHLVDKLQRSPK